MKVVEYMSILTKYNGDIEIEIYTFLLLSQPMLCLSLECPQYGPDRHMDACSLSEIERKGERTRQKADA